MAFLIIFPKETIRKKEDCRYDSSRVIQCIFSCPTLRRTDNVNVVFTITKFRERLQYVKYEY